MSIWNYIFNLGKKPTTIIPPVPDIAPVAKFNFEGMKLLKEYEGCNLVAYRDLVGIYTIGYGHTGPEVQAGLVWTQLQADRQLISDIDDRCNQISKLVAVTINSNQLSAIVCLAYNIGMANFRTSTLLSKINTKDFAGAADEFIRWNHAGGSIVPGLTRRRMAERNLFIS